MDQTIINDEINRRVTGYMVNAVPSKENMHKTAQLQALIKAEFGDLVWNTPPDTLHITLLDWIAPRVDYGEDKSKLFEQLFAEYDAVMADILDGIKPIKVVFNEVKISPNAIFIMGHDEGQFEHIRNEFLKRVNLLPNTKLPPKIIHSTLARFQAEAPLQPIADFIAKQNLTYEQTVDHFRLVREDIIPQLKHELLKTYNLG